MVRFVAIIFSLVVFVSFISSEASYASVFSAKKTSSEVIPLEETELKLSNDELLKLDEKKERKTIKELEVQKSEEEKLKAFEIQKKQDVEDIKSLWAATLERNNVIKFAIKKIDMNSEERQKHSSKMVRTLSTLISGATILPYVFGMDAYAASGAAAATSLVAQAARNKLGYNPTMDVPISDTELIQLATLVEDLQNNLIKNYYAYRSSIESLKECRSKLLVYEKNYNDALKKRSESSALVAKAMYEKQKAEELKLKNEIKLSRLALERFAGEEAVNSLHLSKVKLMKAGL